MIPAQAYYRSNGIVILNVKHVRGRQETLPVRNGPVFTRFTGCLATILIANLPA
jgi:hypothetical protein